MTRKDYIAIAKVLNDDLSTCDSIKEGTKVRGIILSIADIMAQDNERFDRERFYVACGLNPLGFLDETNTLKL